MKLRIFDGGFVNIKRRCAGGRETRSHDGHAARPAVCMSRGVSESLNAMMAYYDDDEAVIPYDDTAVIS
jgi:hypothetical protein